VPLERKYSKLGLLVKKYRLRGSLFTATIRQYTYISLAAGAPAPQKVVHTVRTRESTKPLTVAILQRPAQRPESVLDLLFKLDSWVQPGLTEAEFRELFASCQCGLIMTRRVFEEHECLRDGIDIIDLTGDSDDDN
jgi:hypothetical protein